MNRVLEIRAQAAEKIEASSRIVLTSHHGPDGDAIGSILGLGRVLRNMGKEVRMIVPNAPAGFLHWMPDYSEVINHQEERNTAEEAIAAAEMIIHLDYNHLDRSGDMQPALEKASATRLVIDHHPEPDDFADMLISHPELSSTCEMVYRFIEGNGWLRHLDLAAAEALYTGLITDTGNFRFGGTSPDTHRVAAHLLEIGVQPQRIASLVYDSNTPARLKLLSRLLGKMEVLLPYRTSLLYLTAEDYRDIPFSKGDTEGFVNYGLSLRDVELSIFAYPWEDKVKMSFRSKTDFDVNRLAREHFDGGGHRNAAGALSHLGLEETLRKIKEILPQYEELQEAGTVQNS